MKIGNLGILTQPRWVNLQGARTKSLVLPSPFFPGISRKLPETQGNGRFFEKNDGWKEWTGNQPLAKGGGPSVAPKPTAGLGFGERADNLRNSTMRGSDNMLAS